MPTSTEIYNLITSGNASLNQENASLTPSTQIQLYEIDFSEIAPTTINFNYNGNQPINNGIFRVYNDYNLFNITSNPNGTIKWQNNYYYPFPIAAEGFEYSSAGTLPTPKVSISNLSADGSNNSFYRYIRMQIQDLGDIIGAKFTRIKTFLKYIDGANFSGNINPYNPNSGVYEIELPRDIYYIDRKTVENRDVIEYQLASVLDVENVVLPARTILSTRCPFQYRGEGCIYEYNSRLTYLHSGVYANTVNPGITVRGLQTAPPVATANDQLFIGGVFANTGISTGAVFRISGGLGNSGLWKESGNYVSGDFIYLENKGLKFYYVCINNHTSNVFNAPPNINYWIGDSCAKSLSSCRSRWLKNPAFRPIIWPANRNGEDATQFTLRLLRLYASGEWSLFRYDPLNTGFLFPRRPGAENPLSERAHGIPKDYQGNYLNGFLPFGGFPGTNQPQV
jgi:lambda family phage minor tail protein L